MHALVTQVQRPTQGQGGAKKVSNLDDVVVSVQSAPQQKQSAGFFSFLSCCTTDTAVAENPPVNRQDSQQDQENVYRPNHHQQAEFARVQPPRTSIMQPPPFNGPFLMPPLRSQDYNKKTLVLDLDETLVHSSFKPVPNAHFVIPVEIENEIHKVYVLKRPWVDEFLIECAKLYEIVIFTASLSKYADPLLDQLDTTRVTAVRLFREACVHYCGNYVKDLSRLGRDMRNVIIVDNSPHSYAFHPYNAVAIDSWFDDENDLQLEELHGFLVGLASIEDVSTILDATKGKQF